MKFDRVGRGDKRSGTRKRVTIIRELISCRFCAELVRGLRPCDTLVDDSTNLPKDFVANACLPSDGLVGHRIELCVC